MLTLVENTLNIEDDGMNERGMNIIKLKDDDIPEFSLKGQKYIGKVVDIYDGDTCRVIFKMDNKICKFSCRLTGIDTPEIRPLKTVNNRDEEIIAAKKARNRLIQLATSCQCELDNCSLTKHEIKDLINTNEKLVQITCHEFDKYGRLLIDIYDIDKSDKSFNQILIEENLAKAYDGGKKENWN